MQIDVQLPVPVPAPLADELASRVYFVSAAITDFELRHDRDGVTAVLLTAESHERPEELRRQLVRMVETEVLAQRPPEPEVVWRSAAADTRCAEAYDQMVARRMAVPVGEGMVALGSPVLELIDDLDAALRDLALGLGGSERRYPTLLPTEVLDRSGYLASFPHFVMFATRLESDADTYQRFARDAAAGDLTGRGIVQRCGSADYCLPPTMCYHTFHELTGTQLPANGAVVTARGKSFRHESRYHRSLERLWDFTIREIVFLGTRAQVVEARTEFMRAALALIECWDLPGRCEVANDPFFAGADAGERILSQRLLKLKYELRLSIAPGRTLAAGSFNFHDRHFSEPFTITLADGRPAYSACVGFGLERLAYAFLCRHGLETENWPDLKTARIQEDA